MIPRRRRITPAQRCKSCSKKGTLYLTKSANESFCFDCLKRDKSLKIRAVLCTLCGYQKRARRLPLQPPKNDQWCRCWWKRLLTRTYTGKFIVCAIGILFAFALRLRGRDAIDPVTSLSFWLLTIPAALFSYFFALLAEERFDRSPHKKFIHAVGFGSMLGFGYWVLSSESFQAWLACFAGGVLAGILYLGLIRIVQYVDSNHLSPK
jgi:hypothetical protein